MVNLTTSWDVWHHKRNHFEFYGTKGRSMSPTRTSSAAPWKVGGQGGHPDRGRALGSPVRRAEQEHPQRGPLANYRTAGPGDMVAALQGGRDARCSLERTLHGVE